jgi:hypothetical protein
MIFRRKRRPPPGVFCLILNDKDTSSPDLISADTSSFEWISRKDAVQSQSTRCVMGTSVGSQNETRDTAEDVKNETDVLHSSTSERAKVLPKMTGRFGSHHVLINKERVIRNISPLNRDTALDNIALIHAKRMANEGLLQHSALESTATKVSSGGTAAYRIIGENVTKQAPSTKYLTCQAHKNLFSNSEADRSNMLDSRFSSFGIGSELNPSTGVVYICQLYAG